MTIEEACSISSSTLTSLINKESYKPCGKDSQATGCTIR